jgi:hypothetical protein
MAEIDPIEEKSLLYVLGELSAEEKRRFEEEMDAAPELMERVRELEEGAAALALAGPPKRLPKQVWTNIEKAIETERRVVVPWEWFRSKGWAAAAACAAGWLLYAIFTAAARSANQRLEASRTDGVSTDAVNGASVGRDESSGTNRFATANRDGAEERSRADASATELASLHGQVRLLQGQLAQISQAVTQQQALLNDPARLKFIGLAPVRDGAVNATNGLSPQLQHAIGLAMARELGWLGTSNWIGGSGDEFSRGGGMTNIGGVDFVDLRAQQAGTNSDGPANFRAPLDIAQSNENDPAAPTDSGTKPSGLLPAFASNDHVTVALDNSVGPPGSLLTLSSAGTNGVPVVIGSAVLGNNPVVLTFSSSTGDRSASLFSAGGEGGSFLTVTTFTPAGATNQYHFFPTPGP